MSVEQKCSTDFKSINDVLIAYKKLLFSCLALKMILRWKHPFQYIFLSFFTSDKVRFHNCGLETKMKQLRTKYSCFLDNFNTKNLTTVKILLYLSTSLSVDKTKLSKP